MVRAFEGRARALKLSAGDEFPADARDGARGLGPRTRGLLLGSPSNPDRHARSHRKSCEKIARFVAARARRADRRRDLPGAGVRDAADDGAGTAGRSRGHQQLLEVFLHDRLAPGLGRAAAESACANSRSWRSTCTICAPSVAQHAALACFSPDSLQVFEDRRREFQRRRDFLLPALERAGLQVPAQPDGAFYLYARCPATRHGKRFALDLLEREGVAATPGIDFGSQRDEALRALRLHALDGRPRGGSAPAGAVLRSQWICRPARQADAARRSCLSICSRRARSASTLKA